MSPADTTGAWAGGVVTARATCVLAPNPSPMTLDGTNTWILREPGADEAVVVDPGPLGDDHLAAVAEAIAAAGARVAVVLLTHRHDDHRGGAARFAARVGAPVRSVEDANLADGDVVEAGGLRVEVVATPGHTSDSVCLLVAGDGSLLTGDTILGRGTTVVAAPDGDLGDYLASLDRLRALVGDAGIERLLPGHGAPVDHPAAVVDAYVAHRHERLDQIRRAVRDGAGDDVESVVERVYADVPREVWPAARQSVAAQLAYLRGEGRGQSRE